MSLTDAIEILNKRREHLRQRIESSRKDLTFDKSESGALRLAVEALIQQRDELRKRKAKS